MSEKIDSLINDPVLIDSSSTVSHIIGALSHKDAFDAFCREKDNTMCVNTRDLLLGKDIANMSVRPFLHPVPSLKKDDTIEKAVSILTHNRVRAVPVIQDGDIIGVVRAKDILKLIPQLDNKWIKANQVFSPNPTAIDKKVSLSTAKKIMTSKRFDHLPVVDGNKVLQVLTSYHLLQTILPPERVGKKDIGSKQIHRQESPVGNLGTNSPQFSKCCRSDR